MIRLPLPRERIAERVELTRSERHYLLDVLRLREGDELEVFDGAGGRHRAWLEGDSSLRLGPRSADAPSHAPIALAQALAKGEKMELVIEKATELGVAEILPFASERSVVRLEGRRAEERVERWRRIAASAARQCGRADLPAVQPVGTLESVLASAAHRGARRLFLWEKEHERRLSSALAGFDGPVVLIVGPEGGFSDAEAELARARGAETVSLGARVLRTETVALAALAVAQFLRGELA
ncbi:MAG TPA: 16S rRNA (uracil(1498)-N(3))-methyltransferase [Myxococcales bacterium]|nr:16S rRNA (uracil(1498)-N(3))-methyltransferase [Myxococcales bacterium]